MSWQSGLFTADRRPKPFFDDYRLPLHVVQRGRRARAFGTYRPGIPEIPVDATVEFAPDGGPWRAVRKVRVTNPRGYVDIGFRSPGYGQVRLVWTDARNGNHLATKPAPLARSGNAG